MNVILRHTLSFALGSALLAIPAFAVPQGQDSGQQDPAKTQPPAVQRQSQQQLGSEQPVPQQDTVNPKNSKDDVEAIGNRKVSCHMNWFSLEKEIGLGKQLAQEVERSSKMIDDPIVTEYVNRLGQNLVRNSDAKVPFTFQVVESDQLNAFALPGGFIFVNTGLIEATETEAELAGAMAHEIAHVAARHITRQATRGQIVNYASLPMILLGGWTGYAVRQGAGLGIPLTFLSFDRGFESEADMLGLQYMYKAGYDPTATIDLFERMLSLEKRNPGVIAKVFNTHPMTSDRITKT